MNPLWAQIASRADIVLDERALSALDRYLDLLLRANERMNLTRITDRAAAEVQHVADALTVLPFLPRQAHLLADIGSGGGVPGIPLAIARPDVSVVLIESTRKKADFLRQAIEALELSNVSVVADRAEDVGRSQLRESFDVVLARAVATMDWLAEWCLPLVKKGGWMLAMKGPRVEAELPLAARAIKILGGGKASVLPAELAISDHRVIVKIPKIARTDFRFPRLATSAKGKPIGV